MGQARIIFVLAITSIMLVDITQSSNLFNRHKKIAQFRVYLQDILSGSNATVLEVARAHVTATSPTSYGLVRVMDDMMTLGPDPNSERVGRAQGLIANTDIEESGISVNINFVFTGGEYKGSTLCIVGKKSLLYTDQELPVVGGTGIFRWARGFSISNIYSHDDATGNSILLYDMHVVYMAQEFGNDVVWSTGN